jgi:hypothetical protein
VRASHPGAAAAAHSVLRAASEACEACWPAGGIWRLSSTPCAQHPPAVHVSGAPPLLLPARGAVPAHSPTFAVAPVHLLHDAHDAVEGQRGALQRRGEEAEREGRQQQRVCLTTAQTEPREGAQALIAAGCSMHSWGQQAWPGQRWHVCGCTCAPACRDPAPSPPARLAWKTPCPSACCTTTLTRLPSAARAVATSRTISSTAPAAAAAGALGSVPRCWGAGHRWCMSSFHPVHELISPRATHVCPLYTHQTRCSARGWCTCRQAGRQAGGGGGRAGSMGGVGDGGGRVAAARCRLAPPISSDPPPSAVAAAKASCLATTRVSPAAVAFITAATISL